MEVFPSHVSLFQGTQWPTHTALCALTLTHTHMYARVQVQYDPQNILCIYAQSIGILYAQSIIDIYVRTYTYKQSLLVFATRVSIPSTVLQRLIIDSHANTRVAVPLRTRGSTVHTH